MSRIDAYNSFATSAYGKNTNDKVDKQSYESKSEKTSETKTQTKVQLSERAQKLLEELKEKYKNADFMVADYETDEEASEILSRGTKEFSVLFDPDTLEAMANDEATKDKYLGLLDQATGSMDSIKEQLGDDAKYVKSIGITISDNGEMTFFAQLEKSSQMQKERIEAHRQEAKEEAKKAEKKEAKEKQQEELRQRTSVRASSVEELLKKIKEIDWSAIRQEEKVTVGGRVDFSV